MHQSTQGAMRRTGDLNRGNAAFGGSYEMSWTITTCPKLMQCQLLRIYLIWLNVLNSAFPNSCPLQTDTFLFSRWKFIKSKNENMPITKPNHDQLYWNDSQDAPHTWYLSCESITTLLEPFWRELNMVAMKNWKKDEFATVWTSCLVFLIFFFIK